MKKIFVVLYVLLCSNLFAQNTKPAFWNEIQQFRKQDSVQPPPANAILFVGSSSFTRWIDVQNYFPGYTIINRGFGGSTLLDVLRYEEDVIFKYNPKQILIYCGENDIASSDTVTAATVFNRLKTLFSEIRAVYPEIPIAYISMKPSPSRWNLKDKFMGANNLIEKYLQKQKKAQFINVWKPMLNSNGKPKTELFVEDRLHMNAKGYAIWQKLIQPVLLK
jgi:Lysophospholipase L1 and related esterases